jgi:alpha-beta hydrolase superfamily lysophospholipase
VRYQPDASGDWGHMQGSDTVSVATETLAMADGTSIFLRIWKTNSAAVLFILHGLGGHSGWYIDMGNELAARGLNVYAVDHRGFGRSGGHAGHIDSYHLYVEDTAVALAAIRARHPGARVYVLGHSMGGIFTAHLAARHADLLTGAIFLNPWIQEVSQPPLATTLRIVAGGLLKSRRAWQVASGHETMTANPEAIQMLQGDTYWRRSQTAAFLVQILQMRLAVMKLAPRITLPTLVLQAEEDRSILATASHKFYAALASRDKTWKSYPNYHHDSEFEADRSLLDNDLVSWIAAHALPSA